MAEETKSKTGKIVGNILFVVFLLGAGGYLGYQFLFAKTDDPILGRQLTAEEGLTVYLDVADGFKSQKYNFEDVRKCVPEADWQWFQDNADQVFEGSGANQLAGISTGADPTQVGAIARITFMQDLLTFGPYGINSAIVERSESGNEASFMVWKTEHFSSTAVHYNVRVRLTKVGKYWKVKDFAGGRARHENRLADEDFVEVGTETIKPDGTIVRTGKTAPNDSSTPPPPISEIASAAPPAATTTDPGALQSFGDPPADSGSLPSFGDPTAQAVGDPGLPSFGDPGSTTIPPPADSSMQPFAPTPSESGELAPLDAAGSLTASEDQAMTELASASRKWAQMRYVEALEHGRRALDIRIQLYGPTDPRTMEAKDMVDNATRTLGL